MVLLIQVIGIIVVLFTLMAVIYRFFKNQITVREFMIWGVFWIVSALLIIQPEYMSRIADLFGVGRGVDVIIYLALLFLFYTIFRINVRMERIEQDITKVVKESALRKK